MNQIEQERQGEVVVEVSDQKEDRALGRLVAFDIRDMSHPMKGTLPKKAVGVTKRFWNASGWWGDQKEKPHCVAFAWTHWVEDGPVTHKGNAPIIVPADLYSAAQKIDEWEGENYDGTSVRAGAKILMGKGFIQSYKWAWDIDTTVQALLTEGPVVVGTNWYEEMFYPKKGVVKVGGEAIGGHAYLLNGVNTKTKTIRIKNSWGRNWGNNGHATISFADMERLIGEYGEVCLAVEIII